MGYTSLQRSNSKQHQYIGPLQNAPKHTYSPSLDPTPNHWLSKKASINKVLDIANVKAREIGMIETRELEIREYTCVPHRQETCSHVRERWSYNQLVMQNKFKSFILTHKLSKDKTNKISILS